MHQFEYLKVVVCPQAVSTPSLMVGVPSLSVASWLLSVSVRGEEGRYYLPVASHPTTTSHTTQLHTDMETRLDNHPIFAVLVPACMEESRCHRSHCTAQYAGTHSIYLSILYLLCILINL